MINLAPVILTLFVLAAVLRIDFYFNIVYLLAGVYALSRLWSRQVIRQVRAERRLVNRAFPGERIAVELVVRNQGWLPAPWVEVNDSLPVALATPAFYREVTPLGPHEERRFAYTLDCERRGYYAIGPLNLHVGDLFGVAPPQTVHAEVQHVIVYPQVLSLRALGLPTHSPLAVLKAPAPLYEDPARVMGVRDYTPGDSPRRIHWSASAAAGKLLVKRYQPAIARETFLCLDMALAGYDVRRRYDAPELAIVAAASIANHIIVQERLAVGLATQALDPLQDHVERFSLLPRRERAHLMNLLEVLARVQLYTESDGAAALPFPEFLRRESVRLSWGATLVVMTGCATASLLDTLAYLRQTGFAVALLLVMPTYVEDEALRRRVDAFAASVPVYPLWRESDIATCLFGKG